MSAALPLFLKFQVSLLYQFPSARASFSLSFSACLLVKNSLSFPSSNIFNSSSYLKDIFARYRILGWWYFLSVKMLSQCLLVSMVSDETFTVPWTAVPFYVTCSFSMTALMTFLYLLFAEVWLGCIWAWFSLGLSSLGLTNLLNL